MNVDHREWTDRFSDYLARDLEAADSEAVDDHLAECGSCRHVLEELRQIIARAGGVQHPEPPRDLWGGIAAAIQAPVQETWTASPKVIALPTGSIGPSPTADVRSGIGTRIAFSLPQLAAASIVLIAVSATTTWLAGPGFGVDRADNGTLQPAGVVTFLADVPAPPRGLSAELSALEETLAAAFATLDANTVRILERNLNVIEQAIADSHRALAQDPGNEFLADHLDQIYQRKLTYLRDATRLVEWTG